VLLDGQLGCSGDVVVDTSLLRAPRDRGLANRVASLRLFSAIHKTMLAPCCAKRMKSRDDAARCAGDQRRFAVETS